MPTPTAPTMNDSDPIRPHHVSDMLIKSAAISWFSRLDWMESSRRVDLHFQCQSQGHGPGRGAARDSKHRRNEFSPVFNKVSASGRHESSDFVLFFTASATPSSEN